MLADEARTAGFQQAIHEVVKPGDVVVDLGAGTGRNGAALLSPELSRPDGRRGKL
jgi:predicted RNA methylase